MRTRVRAWWETNWLWAIVVAVALPAVFTGAGWIWGHEVTIHQVCGGLGNHDCPPERYVELNLLAGWTAATVVAAVLVVLGIVARRIDR